MADANHTSGTLEVEGFTPYAQIPVWVLRSGGKLPSGAVQLYGVIMTYADNTTHAAFPGREQLAGDLGVSIRSIGKYIKALEDFGAMKVTRRRNKRTGNFYANHYVLRFSNPWEPEFPRRQEPDDPITKPNDLTTPTSVSAPTASSPASSGQTDRQRQVTLMQQALAEMAAWPDMGEDAMDALEEELGGRQVGNDLLNGGIGDWLLGISQRSGGGRYGAGAALNAYLGWIGSQTV
ncbi:MAG: helix-turn-helix domain-containing protein [Cutibacterium avidum]|nr:helix-turn-helix domain-containing protein [Cutibacterium avidum]